MRRPTCQFNLFCLCYRYSYTKISFPLSLCFCTTNPKRPLSRRQPKQRQRLRSKRQRPNRLSPPVNYLGAFFVTIAFFDCPLFCMYTPTQMHGLPLQPNPNRPCEQLLRRLPWYRAVFNIITLGLAFAFFIRAAIELL